MKNLKTLLLTMVCLTFLAPCLVPKAKAGDWDRKTAITFSQPVAIPGMVLPAGTYVFNFLGSTANRNIIDVLSQDEQRVYATIEAIPDYRSDATGESAIVFEDRKAGEPRAIKEWFFPDHRYGHLFVYPETGTLELGGSGEPKSESSLVEAQPEESDYLRLLHQKQTEPLMLAKTDEPESSNSPSEFGGLNYFQALQLKQEEELQQKQTPVQSAMVRELPRTAGHLPLILFSGILLVAVSFGLRLYSKIG